MVGMKRVDWEGGDAGGVLGFELRWVELSCQREGAGREECDEEELSLRTD